MRLKDLLRFKNIVIQCHDNPDADALASGYALKWFFEKASDWKNKRLAMFCVGGSPNDNPDVDAFLQNVLTEEQKKYIKVFYCQGGFNYEKMKAPSRLAMKMFVSTLRNKKDATEKEKVMAEKMASSYDISDVKYIEPIVAYLLEKDNEKAV